MSSSLYLSNAESWAENEAKRLFEMIDFFAVYFFFFLQFHDVITISTIIN